MQLKGGQELQNGKYRIIRVLGQGGFGITYLAEHTMLDKNVAIKEFFPKEYCDRDDSTSHVTLGSKNTTEIVDILKNKFIKEAKNISKLRHPNIITIHDIFQENSTAYYVMDFINGNSLSYYIHYVGSIEEEMAIKYIQKIAAAVRLMHEQNMNHLDIKPANIMIRHSDDEPILIDFGLSKQYDANGGQTSTTPIGISHGYAPIEQYKPGGVSQFSPQTDIYALGATLYALLRGSTPPHYSEILEEGLPPLPFYVSELTNKAIKHALEIKKGNRPSSIKNFLDELNPDNNFTQEVKKERHSSNNTSTQIEEETILFNNEDNEIKNESQNLPSNENNPQWRLKEYYDNIEFVDLGLSQLWSKFNFGATNYLDSGIFFDLDYPDIDVNYLPTRADFDELFSRSKLYIEYTKENQYYLRIVGPNGNELFFPFLGASSYRFQKGLFWTKEGFLYPQKGQLTLHIDETISFTTYIYHGMPARLIKRK